LWTNKYWGAGAGLRSRSSQATASTSSILLAIAKTDERVFEYKLQLASRIPRPNSQLNLNHLICWRHHQGSATCRLRARFATMRRNGENTH
jgi:hypothetical protein